MYKISANLKKNLSSCKLIVVTLSSGLINCLVKTVMTGRGDKRLQLNSPNPKKTIPRQRQKICQYLTLISRLPKPVVGCTLLSQVLTSRLVQLQKKKIGKRILASEFSLSFPLSLKLRPLGNSD